MCWPPECLWAAVESHRKCFVSHVAWCHHIWVGPHFSWALDTSGLPSCQPLRGAFSRSTPVLHLCHCSRAIDCWVPFSADDLVPCLTEETGQTSLNPLSLMNPLLTLTSISSPILPSSLLASLKCEGAPPPFSLIPLLCFLSSLGSLLHQFLPLPVVSTFLFLLAPLQKPKHMFNPPSFYLDFSSL